MACGFLFKANLAEQLIASRKRSAQPTSQKVLMPPEDLATLSDQDIAQYKNADCDIARQLVAVRSTPRDRHLGLKTMVAHRLILAIAAEARTADLRCALPARRRRLLRITILHVLGGKMASQEIV